MVTNIKRKDKLFDITIYTVLHTTIKLNSTEKQNNVQQSTNILSDTRFS